MSTSPDKAAPEYKSEAEMIRDQYFYEDGWHSTNYAQMPSSPDMLFEDIHAAEAQLVALRATKIKAQTRFDKARKELDEANATLHNKETYLAICKLALADALEIPK